MTVARNQRLDQAMLSIVQISEWPATAIDALLAESEQEGFRLVRRAQEEWLSGTNRFSREGEALFAVYEAGRLVAIGGVNRESGGRGRLRRFYVRRDERGKGIGRRLVQHVLGFARQHYTHVALRCDTEAADRFYGARGFTRVSPGTDATHVIDLVKGDPQGSGC